MADAASLIVTRATPGGTVEAASYQSLLEQMLGELQRALAADPARVLALFRAGLGGESLSRFAVPLREDFSFDADAFIERMKVEKPALVFLAYPNNPTGVLYEEKDIERVIRACPGLVVVDEAYHVFAGRTFMSRLAEFSNLLVLRTVSKLGLAGIRLGYLAGPPAWIGELDKVRQVYNVNVLTQAAASFVLERLEVLEAQAAQIRKDREALKTELEKLKGVTVFPSAANFFLVRVADAPATFEALRRQGVLVRNLHPGVKDCLRVTVGTPDENRILLTALREAL